MPASITGCSTSRMSVSRVRMARDRRPRPPRHSPHSPLSRILAYLSTPGGVLSYARTRRSAVGAGPGEAAGGPAVRGEGGGARVVLEQPAGEVAPRPAGETAGADGELGDGRLGQPRPRSAAKRWSRARSRRTRALVAAGGVHRAARRGGQNGLGGPLTGGQRLADALAGHRVGGRDGIAHEQRPGRRSAPPRATSAGMGHARWGPSGSRVGTEQVADVGSGQSRSGHSRFMSWVLRRSAPDDAEADVGLARRPPGTTRSSRAAGRARTGPTARWPPGARRHRRTDGRRATHPGSRAGRARGACAAATTSPSAPMTWRASIAVIAHRRSRRAAA